MTAPTFLYAQLPAKGFTALSFRAERGISLQLLGPVCTTLHGSSAWPASASALAFPLASLVEGGGRRSLTEGVLCDAWFMRCQPSTPEILRWAFAFLTALALVCRPAFSPTSGFTTLSFPAQAGNLFTTTCPALAVRQHRPLRGRFTRTFSRKMPPAALKFKLSH